MRKIQLGEIAYGRSGDKGNTANIGIIAYTAEGYAFLAATLTNTYVFEFIRPLGALEVIRYELPNLWALNFVCRGILAGGASLSLRSDAQGKALGQALLAMPLDLPMDLWPRCRPGGI